MRIEGREVIGKQTEISARTLLSVSSIVIVIQFYKISENSWNFLGQEIPAEVVNHLLPLLLIFLAVGHVLHWSADLLAHRNWFKKSEVPDRAMDTLGHSLHILAGLAQRVKWFADKARTEFGDESVQVNLNSNELIKKLQDFEMQFKDVNEVLQGIPKRREKVALTAAVLIYIWYLAIPELAFICAILSTYRDEIFGNF